MIRSGDKFVRKDRTFLYFLDENKEKWVIRDFESNTFFLLKRPAKEIWDLFDGNTSIGDISKIISQKFEVDEKVAQDKILKFTEKLIEFNLINLRSKESV